MLHTAFAPRTYKKKRKGIKTVVPGQDGDRQVVYAGILLPHAEHDYQARIEALQDDHVTYCDAMEDANSQVAELRAQVAADDLKVATLGDQLAAKEALLAECKERITFLEERTSKALDREVERQDAATRLVGEAADSESEIASLRLRLQTEESKTIVLHERIRYLNSKLEVASDREHELMVDRGNQETEIARLTAQISARDAAHERDVASLIPDTAPTDEPPVLPPPVSPPPVLLPPVLPSPALEWSDPTQVTHTHTRTHTQVTHTQVSFMGMAAEGMLGAAMAPSSGRLVAKRQRILPRSLDLTGILVRRRARVRQEQGARADIPMTTGTQPSILEFR